jgi:hypothetical protein
VLKFENGEVLWWTSKHDKVREKIGVYKRINSYWYELSAGEDKIMIRPGWILMKLKMEDRDILHGWRELRPGFIAEALHKNRIKIEK